MSDGFVFPGGKTKAVTFGFDDGEQHDRRLAELFRSYGMKATFFLITGQFGLKVPFFRYGEDTVVQRVTADELRDTYRGMEVASHTAAHLAPVGGLKTAVKDSMDLLAGLCDNPMTGIAYPGGEYTEAHIEELYDLGVAYARTTQYSFGLDLPKRLLEWAPTCRYCDEHADDFIDLFLQDSHQPQLLYLMGHSYELTQKDSHADWEYMEDICRRLAGRDDVWYATNGEIAAYLLETGQAVRK